MFQDLDNSVADALSRLNALNLLTTDLQHLADSQTKDEELKTLISSNDLSIKLKLLKMVNALEIFCDVSIHATKRLIQDRFVWPSMLKDIAKWTRCCIPCQRCKGQRHTMSPIQPFAPTVDRFQHVNIDLVGPFPPSDGFTFLLTCIDRYTRWPESIPVSDISAEAVAKSFITNWISRFGVLAIITTDQGGQFQSRLLYSLKQMLGIQRIRTTPCHPSSNGMVEHLHRPLKQAIRYSTKEPFPVQKSNHPVVLPPRLDQNVPIPATTRSDRKVNEKEKNRWGRFVMTDKGIKGIHQEELCETKPFTNKEIACENNFEGTRTSDLTGRFAVHFPFLDSSEELGSSRDIVEHRLQQIERRFRKTNHFPINIKFMNDYLIFGRMELIPENKIDVPASSSFYLPHHTVPNKNADQSNITRNLSPKASSGISLDDKLMVGPQLQTPI
ncbi:transposon Tf2-6 polyprotein [Trichonephila inaurata madagascariensis]|uniref:RNA-directed DNA polymerase n=1 Tax=Trichonephila inaurata madagascariensis TaxID=2747483 RepID=A0A8X7CBG0_9ARAC|nr:transposon Tf2-6 polyprotein [Trichonephila inaurata madagascariensis]